MWTVEQWLTSKTETTTRAFQQSVAYQEMKLEKQAGPVILFKSYWPKLLPCHYIKNTQKSMIMFFIFNKNQVEESGCKEGS